MTRRRRVRTLEQRGSAHRAVDDGRESLTNVGRDRSKVVIDDRQHSLGVDGGDVRLLVELVDDDVAWERGAELRLGARCAISGLQAPGIR
jgi:hypothetical protein